MEINTSNAVFFSPNENTMRLLRAAGRAAPQRIKNYDVTVHKDRDLSAEFGPDDFVFLGSPTFYGRVPEVAKERFKNFKGNDTPTLLVLTYGNRAYEDALVELFDIAKEQGFVPVAAMVIIGKHSIIREFAKGRPTFDDRDAAEDFVYDVIDKIEGASDIDEIAIKDLPGNRPYRDYGKPPVKPLVNDDKCIKCAHCAANCPVAAIPMDKPNTTDWDKCIGCMRCVAVCPHDARYIDEEAREAFKKSVEAVCTVEKENEFYI